MKEIENATSGKPQGDNRTMNDHEHTEQTESGYPLEVEVSAMAAGFSIDPDSGLYALPGKHGTWWFEPVRKDGAYGAHCDFVGGAAAVTIDGKAALTYGLTQFTGTSIEGDTGPRGFAQTIAAVDAIISELVAGRR